MKIKEAWRVAESSEKNAKMMPLNPFSLMEGTGGEIVLFADLL